MASESPNNAVQASPKVHSLLTRLHAQSEAQEKSWSQSIWYAQRLFIHYVYGTSWSASSDAQMLDKFVALEQDKCQLAYLLARSIGARNIVEAGTSFGVSTIYLALAVGHNVGKEGQGRVIATEKEEVKAERAREHWREAGEEVEPWIELKVGDLLETLNVEMPGEIDMLLLDSEYLQKPQVQLLKLIVWTPMALPTLKIVQPRLRKGAMVLADNTEWAKPMYKELLDYLHDPANHFKTVTTPYKGGFEVAVYLPE